MPEIIASWCVGAPLRQGCLAGKPWFKECQKGRISQIIGHSKWFHRDPIAVLCNSSSTHAVRKKTRAGGYAEEIVSLFDFKKGD